MQITERREGDEYVYETDRGDVRVILGNVRESSGDLTAVVRAYHINGRGPEPLMAPSRLNLVAPRSRAEVAKAIAARGEPMDLDAPAWGQIIEYCCGRTYVIWQRGAPTIRLADHRVTRVSKDAITDFIPAGETSIVYGDGGTLKSTVALLAGMGFAAGREITPRLAPTIKAPVLYLDWETTEDELWERANALSRHFGLDGIPDDLHYRAMSVPLAEAIAHVRAEVDRLGARMVIVDSLGWACGSEPESATSAITTMTALRTLGPDVTRLCVAHITHASARQRTGSVEIFGSRFWRQGARATWETQSEGTPLPDTATVGLFQRKRNRGAFRRPFALRFAFHPVGHPEEELPYGVCDASITDSADLTDRLPLSERIFGLLADGQMTIKQLVDETGETAAAIRARLSDLRKKDMVIRDGSQWGRVDRWWDT